MDKIIIATKNKGKTTEFRKLLAECGFEIFSMAEVGCNIEIDETGMSFQENAILKAEAVSEATGEITIADDSGLMVEFLNGAPGIYSARFAGNDAGDDANNKKLLNLMDGIPVDGRSARFYCAIAICDPQKGTEVVTGACNGHIGYAPKGGNGFGYDPLFISDILGKTFAEMDDSDKNTISHRAIASKKLLKLIEERYGK